MSETHAKLSPSGAKRWMICAAAPAMERGQPDSTSRYAAEGTLAHELAADVLRDSRDLAEVIGDKYFVDGFVIEVDEDLVRGVMSYVAYVRSVVAEHEKAGATVTLEVEQAVPIGQITSEPGAEGTADAVVMADYPGDRLVLDTIDLKFGRGVAVSSIANPQLMLYAAGAREKFSLVFDPTEVRLHIVQPRIEQGDSRYCMSVDELERWVENDARQAAEMAWALLSGEGNPHEHLRPDEDACRFCKAQATCPALRTTALSTVGGEEFADLTADSATTAGQLREATARVAQADDTTLDALFPSLDLIENWITAVRARIEARLLAGASFSTVKLVQGKQGNRAWSDAAAAEDLLKAMRVKHEQMYDYEVISPTSAEKLAKAGDIGPRQWPKLQALITRAEGRPTVAPMSDKREPLVLQLPATEFADLTQTEEALA